LFLKVSIAGLQEEYKKIAEVIAEAKNILLVGGGAVGVEFAGKVDQEIKSTVQ
jgi:NADH dehydrogenase FAD-containing subunit